MCSYYSGAISHSMCNIVASITMRNCYWLDAYMPKLECLCAIACITACTHTSITHVAYAFVTG